MVTPYSHEVVLFNYSCLHQKVKIVLQSVVLIGKFVTPICSCLFLQKRSEATLNIQHEGENALS